MATLLLDRGAHVDRATDLGYTPLYVAAGQNHVAAATLCLDRGADVNHAAQDESTALFSRRKRAIPTWRSYFLLAVRISIARSFRARLRSSSRAERPRRHRAAVLQTRRRHTAGDDGLGPKRILPRAQQRPLVVGVLAGAHSRSAGHAISWSRATR